MGVSGGGKLLHSVKVDEFAELLVVLRHRASEGMQPTVFLDANWLRTLLFPIAFIHLILINQQSISNQQLTVINQSATLLWLVVVVWLFDCLIRAWKPCNARCNNYNNVMQ
jgi:hypothetical protein